MNQYYRVIIRTQYEDKKGRLKYKKESYLVFAISPSDVETKLAKHLEVTDYEIASISVFNVVDIVK